jgi:hypothetical protein
MRQKIVRYWEAKVIDHKLDQFELSLDCTPSLLTTITDDTVILDYGCTRIVFSPTAPCTNKQAAHIPLNVSMPNGTSIQSSHTSDLFLTGFLLDNCATADAMSRLPRNK